jgi:predicted TIM-barrel fold metal-dependent hydrolase
MSKTQLFGIDADAHVDETEATWEYLEEAERAFRPLLLEAPAPTEREDHRVHRLWLIDGNLRVRRRRGDTVVGAVRVTDATRELHDVDARLRHMDELGVEVQVVYPTIFLQTATARPEVELALFRSYNRWMAMATEKTHGRLRWVAMVPLRSMDRALEELRWAKDHGACGALKKGIECGHRPANDPYFFPFYEEASRLDLPICIHIGVGDPAPEGGGLPHLSAISAFTALVTGGVPDRFPSARFGFIETSASWIPYLVSDLMARQLRQATAKPFDINDLFRRSRIYVACQTTDDLPYILKFGTEDNLLLGTDYGHADQSSDLEAFRIIEQKGEEGEISAQVARKIMEQNPRRFYGL